MFFHMCIKKHVKVPASNMSAVDSEKFKVGYMKQSVTPLTQVIARSPLWLKYSN